ncbi:MAG: AAA family ATPase [Leptospiraceae bacterium]|nr:AAA family ATPase [Leptospiraceae bacterium]
MQTVDIAGMQVPVNPGDPGWIPHTNLVLTPTTRRNLQKILHPLLSGYNVLLVGDAGVGKNALVYYINQLRKQPTIRYSFNEDTLPEDLVGAYRIDPRTHNFVWSDGPLAYAIRTGGTFVADEMNLSPPEVLKRFYSVFTDRYLQLLEGDSTVIRAGDGFNFVATQNPAEGFEGRKNLPREIQKYFATVYIDPYPVDELVEILSGLHPHLQRELIELAVRFNMSVEQLVTTRKLGARDLERYHFNIRNLNRLAARLNNDSHGLPELVDIYFRPFRTADDRKQLETLIREHFSEIDGTAAGVFAVPEDLESITHDSTIEIHIDSQKHCVDIGRSHLQCDPTVNDAEFQNRLIASFDDFPPVSSARPVLEAMARAVEHCENVLLECEADVEPEDYVHFFADLQGKDMAVITLSRGMHTADVLGGLKPAGSGGDAVEWVDGPLTTAVRRGDYILLKGLEAAGPELVEKLNMMLDDARALVLPPESGENTPLQLKESARIFALKYFRNQRSTPSISRAFRNRFSAIVVRPIVDAESLREIVAARLGLNEDDANRSIFEAMVSFHLFIRERSARREIGSGNIQPYQFGLTNLRRWCEHIRRSLHAGTVDDRQAMDLLVRGAGVAYLNEISDPPERERMAAALLKLMEGIEPAELARQFQVQSKKKIIKERSDFKRIWWDQKEHWRKAHTGKFKPKLEGRELKRGIEINTPETGGQMKEGPDAWYGSDTQGNKGQGEPGAGGGAWGYRTEELYREFLKKRRALWEYNMGVTLEDFKDTFEAEIQRVTIDFDRLLDPQVDITRRYMPQGSRIDARRYLAYLNGKGDGRVFDRTTVNVDEDRLKGVEIIFAVNKGRRIFNFEYSIATLVAIMSCSIILQGHELPFGVCGYSDLTNMKTAIDLSWFKKLEEDFDNAREEELFYGLARDWHGDTVPEFQLLDDMAESFSPDARTRILVIVSDFRGSRAKVTFEKDLNNEETYRLKETVERLSNRGVILLGVGVGARAISDYVFTESLQVGGENFANLPALMAGRVTELIHKHHNAAVL